MGGQEQWRAMAGSAWQIDFLAKLPPGERADASAQPHFVSIGAGISAMQFERNGAPFAFIGANMWYAPNLAATAAGRSRLTRELDRMQMLGLRGIRLMALSEGPAVSHWRVSPTLQPAPGVFDSSVEQGLDFVMAELGKREMHAILCLGNFWTWSGGMAQYVSWATGEDAPLLSPLIKDEAWDVHAHLAAQFYDDRRACGLWHLALVRLLTRRNSITSLLYKDDPTLYAVAQA